jgi:2-iminobutanoate/2-iminopropanoate deaminase
MKEPISSPDAPKAIGPYSPAVRAAGMVFISGQIPIDPATGNFVSGGIAEQTEQVMKNLKALLTAAGSGFEQVVKTTVYLKSMGDFPAMNEIYGRYFAQAPPARATVAVAALPKDALVEIEVIALLRK